MQPIDEKEALYLASICKYWEIVNAQYKRTIATSEDGISFEAKLNELMQDENIKALVLYFGDFRKQAKSAGAHILTTEYYTDDDLPMILPQRERTQFAGFGSLPGRRQQVMSPEHVQSMISLELAKMQAVQQKQDNERQYEFLSKMLETQKQMMGQQLDFEREKLEMERKAFEDNKEMMLAGAQTPIVTQLLDGLKTLAPVLAGFAGIGSQTAEKLKQAESKPVEAEKPKPAPMTFVARPKSQETANPLAGLTLSEKQQERLLKLAKQIEDDPDLLDDLEELANAPLEEEETEVENEP